MQVDEDRNSPKAMEALKDFVQPQCDPSPSTWKYPHPRVEDKSSRHDSKAGALPNICHTYSLSFLSNLPFGLPFVPLPRGEVDGWLPFRV